MKKMKFVFSSIFLLILFSVGGLADKDEAVSSEEPLIQGNRKVRCAGGENTPITLYSYYVSLENNKSEVFCSGAIIAAHFVLTAANCGIHDIKDIIVRAGSIQRGVGGSLHHVDRFIFHNNFTFKPRDGHDIAVIRVKEAFKPEKFYERIEFDHPSEEIKRNTTMYMTGFGDGSPHVQYNDVLIAPCDKKKKGSIAPDTFCVGYLTKNIGFGDTGSPVTDGFKLVGIVSHFANTKNNTGIITKVAHYRNWIRQIMNS